MQVGGRGTGKTRAVSELIREDITERGVMAINLVGRTAGDVRDTMIRGETGILNVFPDHERPQYLSSQSIVRFHTGAVARIFTSEAPEAIQGSNAEVTWIDELSKMGRNAEPTWTQATLANRIGSPRLYVTSNRMPRNPFLEHLIAHADEFRIKVTFSNSVDNFANLPEAYQREVIRLMRTALGRAWVTGNALEMEGALWKKEWIARCTPSDVPKGGTTVIGIDPAGTTGLKSDETGIVVVRRVGNRGYVLADKSGKHSAEHWPRLVVELAREYRASAIVLERNRGLDFLAAMIRNHDRTIPIREVTSRIGKDDRTLPVANLYELGHVEKNPRIIHAGHFEPLEDQMLTWDWSRTDQRRQAGKASSPDRIDALVHAITDLGLCTMTVLGPPRHIDLPDDFFPGTRI